MQSFRLYYWDFPDAMHNKVGAVTVRQNDDLIVMIDSSQPEGTQNHFLRHELAHIALNHLSMQPPGDASDYDGFIDSESLEAEADAYADRMTEEELNQLMQYAKEIRSICVPAEVYENI